MSNTYESHRPPRANVRTIQNRIQWVLGQHGINVGMQTVESIWASLTTGDDPRPDGVPAEFTFQGVKIAWPAGVGRRLLYPTERRALNAALRTTRTGKITDDDDILLNSEDTAQQGRDAYVALWNRTQQPGYVDPTSAPAKMAALVEEACATTPAEQLLYDIFHNKVEIKQTLCLHTRPHGRLHCMEEKGHDGLHSAGKQSWNDDGVVIKRITTNKRTVSAQVPPARNSELDDLLAQLNDLTNQVI